jgi:hypothetical protein
MAFAGETEERKTPDPGAVDRGFHGAFVTLVQGGLLAKGGQQGANHPSICLAILV